MILKRAVSTLRSNTSAFPIQVITQFATGNHYRYNPIRPSLER